MKLSWVRLFFWLSAIYDFVLGAAFLLAPRALFDHYDVPLPNHFGYIQFPALILLIFAVMFARIAVDPVGRRDLIPFGIAFKLAYASVVIVHDIAGDIPNMWIPFAYADLAFVIIFVVAWRATR